MYGASLDELAEGRGVGALRPVGWRWIVAAERDSVAVDIVTGENGIPIGRPQLQRGGWLGHVAHWLEPTNLPLGVVDAEFEPRLVEIPALHLAAAWLAPATEEQGVFVTFTPMGSLRPDDVLGAADFGALVREIALEQVRAEQASASNTGAFGQNTAISQATAMLGAAVRRVRDALSRKRGGGSLPGGTARAGT